MRARLLFDTKENLADGLIMQIRVWQLPEPTPERPHALKYSLFYGRSGERIIGYDNERGKGDHRHYRDREEPYVFVGIAELIRDFRRDVMKEIGRD
ncbi:toxin-antitoxin system TumE family protein [Mangrovibrevibacter kandeliae]|uniref:toxin-antitoxin system TumE family protein n=1 Tax=Mangrovibrevibacter kandeliae TaxID=2968473 RepID=UPI002119A66E|nr:DUF6516 family protein [Aurantimonas sp. CSK15Z-1]MCQ8784353.1 DUF6516 family protein [Aurantimonas sp. CSK15Z-1]